MRPPRRVALRRQVAANRAEFRKVAAPRKSMDMVDPFDRPGPPFCGPVIEKKRKGKKRKDKEKKRKGKIKERRQERIEKER